MKQVILTALTFSVIYALLALFVVGGEETVLMGRLLMATLGVVFVTTGTMAVADFKRWH